MFKKRYQKKHYFPFFLTIIIASCLLFLTIGFSAFQDNLKITDLSAIVRIDKDIRIMGVSLKEVHNAVSLYEEYNVSNITSNITLVDQSSYVIYKVSVYNLGNTYMGIKDININNENLQVEALNYNLKDKICDSDKCLLGAKKDLEIKVSYKEGKYDSTNTSFNIKCEFNFGEIYSIEYENVNGTNLPTEIISGDTLQISFTKKDSEVIKIVMNNRFLNDNEYSYIDNILTVPNVEGNISVSIQELSNMKKKILSKYVTSSIEEDIPLYDFGAMSYEERKSMFGDIATSTGVYRTNGFTGKEEAIIFRGNITDNYVKFAGYTWRILQIDEEGNLRIILENSVSKPAKYNSSSTITSLANAEEVLNFENSSIKEFLDEWSKNYETWQDKVVISNFCNNFDSIEKTSSGSKNKVYYFESYKNIGKDVDLYTPSITCPSKYAFKSKIGLISAEEYVLAGGAFEKANTNIFLYNENINNYYWTLSPSFYDTARGNGDVFIIRKDGAMDDYSDTLLTSNYLVRPVITINGGYEMEGDGTKNNPYRYEETDTGTYIAITDLKDLNDSNWYIGSTSGSKNVYGIMSNKVSTTLNNVEGLLGKDTAIFTDRLDSISNISGTRFQFVNGEETTDGYLYQIKTSDGRYLKINDDKSVVLTEEETTCKVLLATDEEYSGQINITNEAGTIYLNFYGGSSFDGDDKFAGWEELDRNTYMKMYKVDFE